MALWSPVWPEPLCGIFGPRRSLSKPGALGPSDPQPLAPSDPTLPCRSQLSALSGPLQFPPSGATFGHVRAPTVPHLHSLYKHGDLSPWAAQGTKFATQLWSNTGQIWFTFQPKPMCFPPVELDQFWPKCVPTPSSNELVHNWPNPSRMWPKWGRVRPKSPRFGEHLARFAQSGGLKPTRVASQSRRLPNATSKGFPLIHFAWRSIGRLAGESRTPRGPRSEVRPKPAPKARS